VASAHMGRWSFTWSRAEKLVRGTGWCKRMAEVSDRLRNDARPCFFSLDHKLHAVAQQPIIAVLQSALYRHGVAGAV